MRMVMMVVGSDAWPSISSAARRKAYLLWQVLLILAMEYNGWPISCADAAWQFGKLHGRAHVNDHDVIARDRHLASMQWPQYHNSQSKTSSSSEIPVKSPRIFLATDYGADPTGGSDSTIALQQTINEAFEVASTHVLMPGIVDLGGVEIHLGGGQYIISKPLTFPDTGGGNILIHGGTIRAAAGFAEGGYLIEAATTELREEWEERKREGKRGAGVEAWRTRAAFEGLGLRDLTLDGNFTAGGLLLLNALRTTVSNCYVLRFPGSGVGIDVQGGHETLIHHSFLGQHVTSGAHPLEPSFSGTAIVLAGNDNAVTDVVVFSAAVGIEITGEANVLTGVHLYNKATRWGGEGIVVRRGADQTRIVGCYLDYTGIALEESKQISITNSYFLGDAAIVLRSASSLAMPVFGLTIAHNMFSGSGRGVAIVQLDGSFSRVVQTCVADNSAAGMALRATRARASASALAASWTFDLSRTLLFPDALAHVHYSFFVSPDDPPPSSSTSPPNGTHNIIAPNGTHNIIAPNGTHNIIAPNGTHNIIGRNNRASDTGAAALYRLPRHALRSVAHNSIVVASDAPVLATVSVDVDQSSYDDIAALSTSSPDLYT